MTTELLFSVGEYSADLYAAGLARHLRAARPDWRLAGLGGARMAAAGIEVLFPLADDGVMGLSEAAGGLDRLRRARAVLLDAVVKRNPAAVVFIDYGGFNLALARELRKRTPATKLIYYIPPKVWAWGTWRARRLRRDFDRVLTILPFEDEWLRARGVNTVYAGNPLPEIIDGEVVDPGFENKYRLDADRPGVLLLPGSRRQEWERLLPPMLAAAARFAAAHPCEIWLAPAPALDGDWLRETLARAPVPVKIMTERYQAMRRCRAALAASGTVTLELALLGAPTAVAYRMAPLTWLAAKALVRVKYAALPNLLLDREVQPELLQGDCTAEKLAVALETLWPAAASAAAAGVREQLRQRLGVEPGLRRAADLIRRTVEE